MRLTIIIPDGTVIKNGVGIQTDLSSVDFGGAHALQWYEDHGEVEFGNGKRNVKISSLDAEPWITSLRLYDEAIQLSRLSTGV